MFKGVKYRKLEGNEYYIKEYFDALFFFRKSDVVNALESFCKLVGYTINDYMSCHFAVEFPSMDEEYFGEEGVVFYLDYPAVEEDVIIILSYQEFITVVEKNYRDYLKCNEDDKMEMLEKLEYLKIVENF